MINVHGSTQGRPAASLGRAWRWLSAAPIVVLFVATAVVVPATPADAAAYRYWSYWQGSGSSWDYASLGAGGTRPADGSVEGWRFAVSEGANSSNKEPRTAPSFASICGSRTAASGEKLVALVIDYGVATDAPRGEKPPGGIARFCVAAPSNASGAGVLTRAVSVRSQSSMVCGINNYPKTECAAVVREPAPTQPKPSPSSSSKPSGGQASSGSSSSSSKGSSGDGTPKASNGSSSSTDDAVSTQPDAPTSSDDAPAATAPSASGPSSADGTPESALDSDASPEADPPIVVTSATTANTAGASGTPIGVIVTLVLLAFGGAAAFTVKRRRP